MSFSAGHILALVFFYLSALFAVAHVANRGLLPRSVTHHPATYVLSLGVFAGAMATNGVMDLAHRYGYNFILYYAGAVLMFVMATLLLIPLLRLCRVYQLASLADVLSFRFRSPRVGAAVTVAMCITLLPLLALQIQAVGDGVHVLVGATGGLYTSGNRHDGVALLFCLIIAGFAVLFGSRNHSSNERNTGLVTAMAFESLVKLAAMLVLLAAALYGVFDGFGDLNRWLRDNTDALQLINRDTRGDTARALLLVFFAGAVAMPHLFHMLFAENTDSNDLRAATWGLPLYLLLLAVPVLPLAWAGIKLGQGMPADYSGLGIGLAMNSTLVSTAAFIATLSAASATIIITTLALANMCLNHLVLPARVGRIGDEEDIYGRLVWLRRSLITVLILAGYTFYVTLSGVQSLSQLGLLAFAGVLQFLPGILAVPYWPNANRSGLLAGLWAGLGIWFFSQMLPAISDYQPLLTQAYSYLFGPSVDIWTAATMLSLGVNIALFITVSLLARTRDEEKVAAEICSMDDLTRPTRQLLSVHTAAEFADQLALALGPRTAHSEVQRALAELHFSPGEDRPYALRRLRTRLEANLSGLLGPAVAHNIIDQCLPFQPGGTEDLHLIERNLDAGQFRFSGLAADLDNLRRHYRETLDKLPIGVCSVGSDGEMLMWNRGMERLTGIAPRDVLGSLLVGLPEPWRQLIEEFHSGSADTLLKAEVDTGTGDSGNRWVSLHRTSAEEDASGDTVILVEDITDFERLEEELLHNERLASIGRLAAGVAHEIGNPVTGIACLAQNLEYLNEPEEVQLTARDILKQTERVSRIVESLVNFSHVGSGAGELRLNPSNLADCVDEAIHLLSLDREARPVSYHNHCDRELVVMADSQRLLQVFVNLLGNARDACDEGGQVQVCAHLDGEQVLVDVDDNGCGIPAHLQSQVFEPFFTTKDPGAGTGLGLALVFSIMEDMGGQVQVTSPLQEDSPNPGARFTLTLARGSYDPAFTL